MFSSNEAGHQNTKSAAAAPAPLNHCSILVTHKKKSSFIQAVCVFLCVCVPLQFDATLDVLSSAIVLWRYSNAAAVHSAHREYM